MRELLVVAAFVAACGHERRPVPAHAIDTTPCTPRTAEKLGVPFVRVCASDLAGLGVAFEPFWIAAAPVGCSAGAHDTIPCPSVVALVHRDAPIADPPPAGTVPVIEPRLAALSDLATANRLCAMRFGGRLPTRMERILAREAVGASTLVVLREGTNPTRDELRELAEWVTERAWEQPSRIDETAGPGLFPIEGRATLGSKTNVACRAKPVSARGIDIGRTCLGGDCVVRSAAAVPRTFALACEDPHVPAPPPQQDLAAFRCVVPPNALTL